MDSDRAFVRGTTPSLVLAVLRDGPMHGYGIAREIERRSGRALRIGEGTLYPVLHSLERSSWIVGEWRREEGSRDRKTYSLTPSGTDELDRRTSAWSRLATAIDTILVGDSHGRIAEPGTSIIEPRVPRRRRRVLG
jgi:PadR family transcriptional regulator PadR